MSEPVILGIGSGPCQAPDSLHCECKTPACVRRRQRSGANMFCGVTRALKSPEQIVLGAHNKCWNSESLKPGFSLAQIPQRTARNKPKPFSSHLQIAANTEPAVRCRLAFPLHSIEAVANLGDTERRKSETDRKGLFPNQIPRSITTILRLWSIGGQEPWHEEEDP